MWNFYPLACLAIQVNGLNFIVLNRLPSLDSMRVFECAARHCSFTRAAEELSVTQGAVSSRIKQLEEQIGVKLFKRSIRQVQLTAPGKRLLNVISRVLKELEDELTAISPKPSTGFINIALSTYVATRWLSPRLREFYQAHPDIGLKLHHTVNDPDFDISNVDLAIRWENESSANPLSETLIMSPMFAACSPALLEKSTQPWRYELLRNQTFLHDQPGSDNWALWLFKAGLEELGAGNGPEIADPNVRVQAAIDGHGWILADFLISKELESGALIKPFDLCLHNYSFQLLYSNSSALNPSFQIFKCWLLKQGREFESELIH